MEVVRLSWLIVMKGCSSSVVDCLEGLLVSKHCSSRGAVRLEVAFASRYCSSEGIARVDRDFVSECCLCLLVLSIPLQSSVRILSLRSNLSC